MTNVVSGTRLFSCVSHCLQRKGRPGAAFLAGGSCSGSLHHSAEALDAVEQGVALLDDRLVKRALHVRPVRLKHASDLRMTTWQVRPARNGNSVCVTRALSILQFSRPAAMNSESSPSRKAAETPNADAII